MTADPWLSSVVVRNDRSPSVRSRTPSQEAFVPTTLVVQLVDDAVSVADDDVVGATAAMSGAAVFDASASGVRRVGSAGSNPPPNTTVLVDLRRDDQEVCCEELCSR